MGGCLIGSGRFVGPGKHQYVWNRPTTPVALTPDIVARMHEARAEQEAMHATKDDDDEDGPGPGAPRAKRAGRGR